MASKRSASASKWVRTRSSSDIEHLPHGGEAELAKEPGEATLGGPEVRVVGQGDPAREANPGVGGIQLPGMQVEHGGISRAVDRRDSTPRDRVGKEAEVGPAGDRNA